jgi:hypothetical protein
MAPKIVEEPMVQVYTGAGNGPPTLGRPVKSARNFLVVREVPKDVVPLYDDNDAAVNASKNAQPAAIIWKKSQYGSSSFGLLVAPLTPKSENICEVSLDDVEDYLIFEQPNLLVLDKDAQMMGFIYRVDRRNDQKTDESFAQIHYRRMPFGGKKSQALAKAASLDSGRSGKHRIILAKLGRYIQTPGQNTTFSEGNTYLYAWSSTEFWRFDLKQGKLETVFSTGGVDDFSGGQEFPTLLDYIQPFEQGYIAVSDGAVWKLPARPKVSTKYPKLVSLAGDAVACDRHGRNWVVIAGYTGVVHRVGGKRHPRDFLNAYWAVQDENGELIFPAYDTSKAETKEEMANVQPELIRVKLDGSLSISRGRFVIPQGVRAVNRRQRVFFAAEGVVPIFGGSPIINMVGWEYTAPGPGRDLVRWRPTEDRRTELEIFDAQTLKLRAITKVDGRVAAAFAIRKGPWVGIVALLNEPEVIILVDQGRLTKL